MDEQFLRTLAQQLRKPDGELGKKVGENMNVSNRFMNLYTIEALQVAPHDTILEIGMGNGHFVQDIVNAAPHVNYIGCDYSTLMIKEATSHNQALVNQGNVRFIHCQANELPFTDHTFNKIFTINTLYFWEQPEKELAEIYRVLKPGGHFFLTVRSLNTMQNIPVTAFGFKLYDQLTLEQLLHQSGFQKTMMLEKNEPDLEFSGNKIRTDTWIFCCTK